MNNDSSAARALADDLGAEVEALPAGARLPSHRALVERYAASASTVAHALSLLAQRGLVESRPGAGSFRTHRSAPHRLGDTAWQSAALELTANLGAEPGTTRRVEAAALSDVMRAPGPDVVDLNGGYLHPGLRPAGLLRAALTRVAKRDDAWDRPPPGGLGALRDWFAADIGAGLTRTDVIVAPGGQAALAMTLRALTQPGDPVVIESPTYPGTIAAAQAAGLRPVPVALDEQGMLPEHLDDALTRTRARVVVLQPLHQNPTGALMGAERRRALLRTARAHLAFVVEDDYARHLTHADATPAPPPMICDDTDGTVVHVRSLTKATSPNLRIAAVASRGPVTARLRDAFTIDTLLVPAALQQTAIEVVSAPGWRRAQRELAGHLQARREHASAAVARHLGVAALASRPSGGYHLWLDLSATPARGASAGALCDAALARGVAVTSGANYHLPGHAHDARIRLSYVAAPSSADVERGIERLAAAADALPE